MSKVGPGIMTVVIFALLIGLGGAFVVRQQLSKRPDLPPLPEIKASQTVYIPVASMPLENGHTLSLGDIAILKFSPQELAKSQYAGKPFMKDTEQIMGRTLQIAVEKGEVFMPELLYPEGMGPGIAERLSPGYRAVTVPIENIGAVHGFARPGSIVDILFRADAESERPEMTLTLLERIEVLAINTSLLPNAQIALDNDKGTVTLSVTPQQAKVLKVVEGRGELSLTLRNPDDTLELAPFELGEVDPNIGNVSFLNDARADNLADNLADRNTADRRSTNDSADSNSNADTVDRVIGAAEQVTMDDLLGLPRKAPTKQMIVYKGGSREVVEFEAPSDSRVEFMMKGGRIKTPIAHEIPPHRRSPLSTAGFDPRDLSPSAKAGDN